MDRSVAQGAAETPEDEEGGRRGSPSSSSCSSPAMDRNPSPPPTASDLEEEGPGAGEDDAIVGTAYSKHWLFSTLTHLIQIVTREDKEGDSSHMQLTDEEEDRLCRVWDMAMDQDVAGFLQEFKAAEILLGVISKSRCPRLTEICVGILGNIACFPDTCLSLSHNEDLGEVLLLLLGDTDPPTLLETSRLLVTCLSQKDVSSLWLQRIQQHKSVCCNLTFIMNSSTNVELLGKVGELLDKLFDLDEELMKTWITAPPPGQEEEEDEGRGGVDVTSSLLEAAKQLRSESPEGLEVYLHVLQLLTTTDEGIRKLASQDGPGAAWWDFVCSVVCSDLLQPGDPALVLQEQKLLLLHSLDVLSALYCCLEEKRGTDQLPLVAVMLRVLQYNSEIVQNKAEELQQLQKDQQELQQVQKNQQEDQQEVEPQKDQQEDQQEDQQKDQQEDQQELQQLQKDQQKDQQEDQQEDEPQKDQQKVEPQKDQHLCSLIETTTEFLADLLSGISKEAVSELVTNGSLTEKTCCCAAEALLPHFNHVVEQLASVLSQDEPLLANALRRNSLPGSLTT